MVRPNRTAILTTAFIACGGGATWIALANKDLPHDPILKLTTVLLAVIAATSGLMAFISEKPLTIEYFQRHIKRQGIRDTANHVVLNDKLDQVLKTLESRRTIEGGQPDARVEAEQRDAIKSVFSSNNPLDEGARRALDRGDIQLAYQNLFDAAEQYEAGAARRYREAGLLAYGSDASAAAKAFRAAARLTPDDVWLQLYISRLCRQLGDTLGAEDAARAALARARSVIEKSDSLTELGTVLMIEGELVQARPIIEESLEIDRTIADSSPDDRVRQRNLSVSYNKLGDLEVDEGNLVAARAAYEKSLSIREALTVRYPEVTNSKIDIATSHQRLGELARAEGDLVRARRSFESCLEINKKIAEEDPTNLTKQGSLSLSYGKIGDIAMIEGDISSAKSAYADSLTIRRSLSAADPSNTEWQRDLAVGYVKMGDVDEVENDLDAARKHFEASHGISKTLAKTDSKNSDWLRDLSIITERIADLHDRQGEPKRALALYIESRSIADQLCRISPNNATFRNDLSITDQRIEALKQQTDSSH